MEEVSTTPASLSGLGLAALMALAIAVRIAAGVGDDGLGGQDPWAYLDAARRISAFWQGVGNAPHGLFWPLGYPAVGAGLAAALGLDMATALRVAALLLSAAAAPLTAALVRALLPSATVGAWLAGGIVAVGAAASLAGAAVMADGPMLGWLALAAWATAAGFRRPALLPLAALALGLAIVTRQAALVALPAWIGCIGWHAWCGRGERKVPAFVALAALALATPLLLQAHFGGERPGALDHAWLRSWRPWHALQSTFSTVDGHANYAWPQGVYALFPVLHPGYLAPPGLLAIGFALRHRVANGSGRLLLALWLATAVVLFAGMPYQNFRFGLCALVPAAALAGLGLEALRQRAQGGLGRRLTMAGALVCLAWTAAWTPRMADRHLRDRAERRRTVSAVAAAANAIALREVAAQADAWGEAKRPPTVVAFELSLDLHYRHGLDVIDLSELDDAALQGLRDAAARRPLVLAVDPQDLTTQWVGTAVGEAERRLRAAFDVGPASAVGRYRVARLEPRR